MRKASACALVRDEAGRILLHLRSDNHRWGLPGGGIEAGETAIDAVLREVQEETGYQVQLLRLLGIYSDPAHTTITYPSGDSVAYVALFFECQVTGGAPALSDETLEVGWFAPEELPDSISAGHRLRIDDALSGAGIPYLR